LPNERQANLVPPSAAQPRGTNLAQLGLTIAPQADGGGLIVIDVNPNGIAADRGFKSGDVILEVAGKKATSPGDLTAAIEAAQKQGKRSVLLRVKSGTHTGYVTLPVG